jgi:hypothetical protein
MTEMVAVFDDSPEPKYAGFEISARLAWTRRNADMQLDLALAVVRRLPAVHAAMSRGDIDQAKARVITDALAVLPLTTARELAAQILHQAPGLTTGQLRARLAKLVIQADPNAAAAQHRARVRQRSVHLQPTEDSCANLLGLNLPAHTALAAANRITTLAQQLKRAGDPRTLDQLRADTFLNLLLGNTTSTRAGGVELVANLSTLVGLTQDPGHLNGYGPVIADIVRQVTAQLRHTTWTFTIHDDTTDEIYTGTTRHRPTNPDSAPTSDPSTSPRPAAAQRPATSPPAAAQNPVPGQRSATSQRPTTDQRATPDSNGADARQSGTATGPSGTATGPSGTATGPSDSATSRRSTADPEPAAGQLGPPQMGFRYTAADAARRFPTAAMARHVRARDRTCRAPGCRRSASSAHLDHNVPYSRGGLTIPSNICPLCSFHHGAKDRGGWKLWQIKPGVFLWRSPLGRYYIVQPEPP